jgi:hypothetical protein
MIRCGPLRHRDDLSSESARDGGDDGRILAMRR